LVHRKLTGAVRFTQEIFGHDPLADYQVHHPSNPQQPIQQPYVLDAPVRKMMEFVSWDHYSIPFFFQERHKIPWFQSPPTSI
jgi:hypothetical protein